MKKQLFLGGVSLLSLLSQSALAEVLMTWDRIPLPVDLHVGQQRIVIVDRNVQVGIDPALSGVLKVQSMGGAVYLEANAPFDTSRMQLRDMETGEIILLDLKSTQGKAKLDTVRVVNQTVYNNDKSVSQTAISDENLGSEPEITQSALPAPVALVRYAAQSLYAPLRTVEPLNGVHRVAVKLPKSIPNLMPNYSISATPLDSWGLEGYVVTAIRLKNQHNYRIELDPRYLQGYFHSAAFQHDWLGPKGTSEDTTVVYLVTEGKPDKAFIYPLSTRVKK